MSENASASQLAQQALRLWQAGSLHDAERVYGESLRQVPDGHWARPDVRGQLAGVLAQLGRNEEARAEYEITLAEELTLADGRNTAGVRAIRYFLARHLLGMGESQAAVDAIQPLLEGGCEYVVKELEADIQLALGHREDAMRALREALNAATSEDARERLRTRTLDTLRNPSDGD